jgi:lysophospholipase L1-like esterase
MRRLVAFTALAVFLAAASVAAAATPAKVGPPNRITALGDSITRGYDSQGSGCTAFSDCQAFSWATGSNAAVNSYFRRVQAINPSVVLSNAVRGNDAVTGAKVGDLNGQAINAVAGNPDLVLILIGANDVCTSSEGAMTSVTDFRTRFTTAMNTLTTNLPNARIQVMSIPNIFNLWNVLKGNFLAQLTWGAAGICQSMLQNPTSTSTTDTQRRLRVQQRNIDFNTQLQQVCGLYIHCRYDGGAAYALTFAASDVSTLDYFHPNTSGQAKAAATAWNTTFNYTDLTAPTTTITRDRAADGTNDWYRDDVTVTLSATDPNSSVAGTEYFYKLVGAADQPWTKYTGPITVSAEGQTEIDARSVDVNGNIEGSKSDVIKIDKTAPTFTLGCPTSVYLNDAASITISNSNDDRSGFSPNPDGSTSIPTSVAGHFSHDQEIHDQAGNTTQHSCAWDVAYPTPGIPALAAGSATPNSGLFSLGWTQSADPDAYPSLLYTLQHRDADDSDWSDVDTSIAGPSFDFSPETEGTWTYRVKAHDGALETDYSDASDAVKVDRSAPAAPTLSADRGADYAGGGGWFADAVTVSASDNGDPDLQDGSSGSGVDLGSLPAPATHNTSGSYTDHATVKDGAGNESDDASLSTQVDADAPHLSVSCPAAVLLGASGVNANVSASDDESGLASDPSGLVAINTSSVGPKTVSRSATDNVVHSTTKSCTTQVQYMFSGAMQPINPDGSSIFKLGSTVPVKFALTDSSASAIGSAVASLSVAKVSNSVEGTFVEAVSTSNATTGSLFRYDATSQQYIFNLSTKSLTTGTYSLKISLDDGTTYTAHISLR